LKKLAKEEGTFDFYDVLSDIHQKIVLMSLVAY